MRFFDGPRSARPAMLLLLSLASDVNANPLALREGRTGPAIGSRLLRREPQQRGIRAFPLRQFERVERLRTPLRRIALIIPWSRVRVLPAPLVLLRHRTAE